MAKRLFIAALVFVLSGVCWGQERGGGDADVAVPLIMNVLRKAKVSGSLEYWGNCSNMRQFPDFPKLKAPRNDVGAPVETLREMFADDPKMQVTQEPGGMIRMVETDVPQDLLDLTIKHISVGVEYEKTNPHTFDNPGSTLWFILAAPEVKAFMKAADIGLPYDSLGLSMEFSPRSQRISGDLHEVNLSQALDYMLKTFPGLWTYENCPSQKRKRVVFFAVYSSGDPAAKTRQH